MVNRSSISNDEIETKVFWWYASVSQFHLPHCLYQSDWSSEMTSHHWYPTLCRQSVLTPRNPRERQVLAWYSSQWRQLRGGAVSTLPIIHLFSPSHSNLDKLKNANEPVRYGTSWSSNSELILFIVWGCWCWYQILASLGEMAMY
jgi:hypothetical protein